MRREAGPFAPSDEAILAWAVREGVTNIIRHSEAGHADITLTADTDRVTLEITDDGQGRAVEAVRGAEHGSGLRGLAERVAAHGGLFEACGRLERGFLLRVTLPLTPAADQSLPEPKGVLS